MERRLFDDLVLSRSGGGGHTRAGAMPFSIAIHAAGMAALLAVSMAIHEELPIPPQPRLPPPYESPRVFQAGGPAPTASRRETPRRPTSAPTFETPATIPELDAYSPDEAPVGDPATDTDGCLGCATDGTGSPHGVPGGDPLGTGPTLTEAPSPVRIGGDIRPPRKLNHVNPVYPALARSAGVSGIVILECLIGRDGRVRTVSVLRGFPLLNDAASDAVRQWTYTPTLLNGVPVEVVMTVTVRFNAR